MKLLHHPVISINDAVGVEVEKFLDHHGIAGGQARYLEGDEAAVSIADRCWCDNQIDGQGG